MSEPLLLHVQGVSKSFPGVKALEDMHLDLRSGEVLAVVGENGAGKSTLMKLLTGVYDADSGEFSFNGQPFEPTSPKHAQELGISIIHQEFNLMPDLTVAQNIFIGREPRGSGLFLNERRLNAQARELIERLHLPLRPKELVGNLTVAKQQMVEIGKALSYDAKLLIMDEPTAALNDAEVEVLHDLIRRFVKPDTGVIYISHRMDEIKRIADRVTVIRDGRFVGTRDTKETTMKEVISLMVGREISGEAKPVGVQSDREVVLEVAGLSTKELLKDVSFELRKGEILGFAGLMGAGRTEVARAVVGADRIDGGTIRLRGRDIRIHTPAEAAKHRIGYLSEDRKQFGLLLEQEVNANIGLSALAERFQKWGFMKDRAMRATSREYVDKLRIKTPSVAQTAKNLSGGNQQKVVIAKWLVKDCDVLIFDEPTRGIDVGAKEEIYRLLNDLAQQGKSIIMISSELPEVLRMSHRIVVMSEGRVTGTLDAGEATQESVMHYATLSLRRIPTVVADAITLGIPPMPAIRAWPNIAAMTSLISSPDLLYRPAGSGATFLGPGDVYRFLVTGAESGGAYFAMEAFVPPGGGPPPHIHRNEDETFYVLEGQIEFLLGDETITGGAGDFVNVPRGIVHRFHNAGTTTARMILTFTPAGIERFFEETLERALSPTQTPPDNIDEVAARYVAAAPRYGLEFVG